MWGGGEVVFEAMLLAVCCPGPSNGEERTMVCTFLLYTLGTESTIVCLPNVICVGIAGQSHSARTLRKSFALGLERTQRSHGVTPRLKSQ